MPTSGQRSDEKRILLTKETPQDLDKFIVAKVKVSGYRWVFVDVSLDHIVIKFCCNLGQILLGSSLLGEFSKDFILAVSKDPIPVANAVTTSIICWCGSSSDQTYF